MLKGVRMMALEPVAAGRSQKATFPTGLSAHFTGGIAPPPIPNVLDQSPVDELGLPMMKSPDLSNTRQTSLSAAPTVGSATSSFGSA